VPEGERKTATALFADIKGAMELPQPLDPKEARRIADPALQLMMEAIHRGDGYIVRRRESRPAPIPADRVAACIQLISVMPHARIGRSFTLTFFFPRRCRQEEQHWG
jgi:class 3 adenylate cyclase